MKRCPQCNRAEADQTLKFCRVDGAKLANDSAGLGDESITAQVGAAASELQTSILPHRTDGGFARATAPTTGLPIQTPSRSSSRAKPKSRKPIIIAVIITAFFAAASAIVFTSYLSRRTSAAIESIAVMPFENRSGTADSEYLSDGLTESLIYRLSQLPNLKVSPTSSVFRYKGKEAEPQVIANELGVDSVMTGRIVQRGDSITISVNLVDMRNGKSLWGEQYERRMSELLQTQRDIAAEITNNLKLKLSGEGEQRLAKKYTNSNEAYQLYLKGRFHFAKRNRSDLEQSIEYFKQAIGADSNFALAYSALAHSYNAMTAYPYMSPRQAVPLAKAAASRALEIDPALSEAHSALANSLACFDWNWTEAEREFRQAISLNPNDAGIRWRYGMFYLMPLGRHDEAIAEGKRSLELEPLDLNHGANLSGLYFYAGRYDEALEHARQVNGLDANFIVGRWALSQAYIQKGMYAEAIDLNETALKAEPTNPVYLRFAGIAYAKAGRRKEAAKIVEKFREIGKTEYVMSYHLALIYSAMDEKDKAIAELETALREHDYLLPRIKVEPFLDPLRGNPRFDRIVNSLGFPK